MDLRVQYHAAKSISGSDIYRGSRKTRLVNHYPYKTQSFEFGKLRNSIFNHYWYNQNVSVFVHIDTAAIGLKFNII